MLNSTKSTANEVPNRLPSAPNRRNPFQSVRQGAGAAVGGRGDGSPSAYLAKEPAAADKLFGLLSSLTMFPEHTRICIRTDRCGQ